MQRPPGHLVVSGLGTALLAAAAVHHWTELGTVSGSVGPALALALDGGFALAVIYAGRRLSRAGLSRRGEWRVALWTVAGSVTALAGLGATLLVRVFEGRSLVEPAFPLLVSADSGALAGAVAGYYAVRQASEARRAREATRAVSFVNHLLRHDLRNDLATIQGYADLDGDAGDPDHRAVISRKAQEGLDRIEATSGIADTLLGDATLRPMDLANTAREALDDVDRARDVTVEADLDEPAPVEATDGLRSVVDNLVENAVEHAGPGALVRVAVRVGPETVTLAVADDGPGIPPGKRDALFDAENDVGGLQIVDALVDAYGGRVSVADSELGGALFEVTLPRREPTPGDGQSATSTASDT
ncbi:ATP-binding protein [Halorubrum yunnanense]|uniref:histidine kinase n=1 Tax=Halorubrum yunnanense TaxID=1526162 RepID=A0ABD5YE43_9EURY|nr:ATP-binding protein [Halorubrum yunnanense]